jgi:hypothetical protein
MLQGGSHEDLIILYFEIESIGMSYYKEGQEMYLPRVEKVL